MSFTVKVSIEVGDTPDADRAHSVPYVQLESRETVIAPAGLDSASAQLAVVTAALDRLTTSHLEEAKRQIEQILEVIEAGA